MLGARALCTLAALGVPLFGCTTPTRIGACTGSADCPASEMCVDGLCVARIDAGACGATADCRTDVDCLGAVPACVLSTCEACACVARADDTRCAAGERCDRTRGCTPLDGGLASMDAGHDAGPPDAPAPDVPPDAPPGGVGAACRTDADCAPIAGATMTRCAAMLGTAVVPGGYCTAACSSPLGTCAGGEGECVLLGTATFTYACLRACTTDGDCRAPDYACRRFGTFGSDDVCVPAGL